MAHRDDDDAWMRHALAEAHRAGAAGEVPVGAVVVLDGRLVGAGRNGSIAGNDPTAHAEVAALRDAGRRLGNYRLTGTTLYSTVEPCLMCLGALLHARVGRLVWAADDPKVGAAGRLAELDAAGAVFNHRLETVGGVLAREAARLLLDFFRERRAPAVAGPDDPNRPSGEVPKWS